MLQLGLGLIVFLIAIALLMVISQWKIFEKAGQPGWAVLIPIYSTIVLLNIIRKPVWWFFMFFIPIVNIVFLVKMYNELSKSFGQSTGFTVGLLFLPYIFFPMMAFDKSIQYIYNKNNEMDSIGRE